MFSPAMKAFTSISVRNGSRKFSTQCFKVVVAGAAGGIGQPLCLLLKQNPLVACLACYDVAKVTPGVAVDLSHMNTLCKVTSHMGPKSISEALQGANVVVIPAGVPRKPGMSRDDLFNTNAGIVRDIMTCVASCAPCAIIAIITNPVNSMVPIAVEVMKKYGINEECRIIGVTTLDVVRAATFVGELNCMDARCISVPVIGGHAGATIIPVLSQSRPPLETTDESQIKALTKKIQEAGTEVVKAKAGDGSATLSMAFAGAHFTNAILRGLKGEKNVVECGYVKSNITSASYFANPLLLGPNGVMKNLGYGILNKFEKKLLDAAVPILQKNIKQGEDFVKKSSATDDLK